MNLNQLEPGESARILGFSDDFSMKRRLQDLGFVRGIDIKCLFKSPMKDPKAYLIMKTIIAIRNKDARGVLIKKEDKL
ncbi:ferrous iron transport protein A [Anaerococcus sp. WCA-380-WT-2B]|uniref:Ferrous iron transport protein A n=1 Tax=Anaerococcus porci TaxID=2652269 RepID=A0A6N7VSA5_9FIRM|nr:FeoA family protein [Anaerococcus porci]MSS77722.1 ferrous iron transport protein A [Anaerococcus porci]